MSTQGATSRALNHPVPGIAVVGMALCGSLNPVVERAADRTKPLPSRCLLLLVHDCSHGSGKIDVVRWFVCPVVQEQFDGKVSKVSNNMRAVIDHDHGAPTDIQDL